MTTSEAGTAGKESKACAEISAIVNYVMPVMCWQVCFKRSSGHKLNLVAPLITDAPCANYTPLLILHPFNLPCYITNALFSLLTDTEKSRLSSDMGSGHQY